MKLLELEKANPIIYGELKTPGAKRTLCFYVHYDGQPVNESKWAHEPYKIGLKGSWAHLLSLTGCPS
jgi:acetylornithine deacetylase/succinyl-diaminopimelate desuccinylase-like protein